MSQVTISSFRVQGGWLVLVQSTEVYFPYPVQPAWMPAQDEGGAWWAVSCLGIALMPFEHPRLEAMMSCPGLVILQQEGRAWERDTHCETSEWCVKNVSSLTRTALGTVYCPLTFCPECATEARSAFIEKAQPGVLFKMEGIQSLRQLKALHVRKYITWFLQRVCLWSPPPQ